MQHRMERIVNPIPEAAKTYVAWSARSHPAAATPDELRGANNPPERVPGCLWEWRPRHGAGQGLVAYRRPMRDVGWISSHRD